MSAVAAHRLDRLTLAELAPMIRAMPDLAYRATPVGVVVGRFIRWMRNERGATPATVRDYEATLARMSLALADRELIEVTTEDLRLVIDLWAHRTAGTRGKITSHVHAFWAWCYDEGLIVIDPAARIRRPRADRKVARVLPLDARPRLLTAAKHPRDRLGLFCLLTLGVRRAELAGVRVRDFDPDRGRLRVFGKGRKERILPLRGPILTELGLYLAVDLPHVGRPPEGDDYLIYPVRRQADGRGREGETVWAHVGYPKRRLSNAGLHRWWYRQAEAAGLVGPGTTSGLNMHQARHAFATELRRIAGVEAASQALGHADLSTTLGIYGHQDESDLERAMDKYGRWLEGDEG